MDAESFKSLLRNTKGQAGLGAVVITVVVVAVIAVVGIAIFNQVNKTQTINQPLMDLVPLVIAATVVIGGVASLLFIFRRGM